ncbi:LysR family transcriptional regulator [Rhodoplanes sp. Z2-YC6860]|uniref:LysR family transcriptional regulator n=1 Tax=Rhodoplanes sp. Z2-YC6860 TaxID=674703 RepID=UPI00078B5154|nr:LysR family transcriptional regulator [Rhodoplanes sp. Z2-YC6860]AMN39617.1 LysR family transcriptional regulator [Rhodoplanes sp. Z2-YC6860]
MHRRYEHINIPTEVIRTLVVISETGSFTKAGEKLGLTQSAISAQVKRLQVLSGSALFEKIGGGHQLTARGKIILGHARKLLEANDQILAISGGAHDSQVIRLGISPLFIDEFLSLWKPDPNGPHVSIQCDMPSDLAKTLLDGYLDVALLFNPPSEVGDLLGAWQEEFVWVRSPEFVLSPGLPLPVISWPGTQTDTPFINALEHAGIGYSVVFSSSDLHARLTAAAHGLGLMALPQRKIDGRLVVATEYYLPRIKPMQVGIAIRRGLEHKVVESIAAKLRMLAPTQPLKLTTQRGHRSSRDIKRK